MIRVDEDKLMNVFDVLRENPDIDNKFFLNMLSEVNVTEKKEDGPLVRKPSNTNKHWTKEEEVTLKWIYESGKTVKEIAASLGRSVPSVGQRLDKMKRQGRIKNIK